MSGALGVGGVVAAAVVVAHVCVPCFSTRFSCLFFFSNLFFRC